MHFLPCLFVKPNYRRSFYGWRYRSNPEGVYLITLDKKHWMLGEFQLCYTLNYGIFLLLCDSQNANAIHNWSLFVCITRGSRMVTLTETKVRIPECFHGQFWTYSALGGFPLHSHHCDIFSSLSHPSRDAKMMFLLGPDVRILMDLEGFWRAFFDFCISDLTKVVGARRDENISRTKNF